MEEIQARSWVWRSTEASRAAGVVSVLAVAETLACVAAYWALIWVWGVTWHHWIILIAAPMVLLRSPQSIALGVKWFDRYWDSNTDFKLSTRRSIGIVILNCSCSVAAGWMLVTQLLAGTSGWELAGIGLLSIWLVINIGFMIATALAANGFLDLLGAFVGAATKLENLTASRVVSFVFPGIFVGIWIRAVLTRLAATLRFFTAGIWHLPQNWRSASLCFDSFQQPELIPGHKLTTYGNSITLSLKYDDGTSKDGVLMFLHLYSIIYFYLPTLLWRWSIKSTAWLYLPLIWAHFTWVRADGEELRVWAQSYSTKHWNIVSLILTLPYLWLLSIGVFSVEKWTQLQAKMDSASAPMTFSLPLALDWAEIAQQPWLLFYFTSYLLTLVTYFWANSLRQDIVAGGAAPDSRVWHMLWLRRMTNLRAIFTSLGLFLALIYVLRAFDAWGQFTAFITRIITHNPPLV